MNAAGLVEAQAILLLLIVGVAALAALARRFQTPYPIVLVIGGLVLSLIPGMPKISLNPDVFFLVLLPPLLFASAFKYIVTGFPFQLEFISSCLYSGWSRSRYSAWRIAAAGLFLELIFGRAWCWERLFPRPMQLPPPPLPDGLGCRSESSTLLKAKA